MSSLSEETDRFVYQTKRTLWTARLVDEAVSARASRASRFAPWKNAASAEAFRSRRRLPYVADDSRHRFGVGMRPYVSRRISGAVARSAAAAFFGSVRHGAQGRLDSPRPPRLRTERRHVPRGDRCACGGESRGRRGSSDPADLERRVSGCRKTSRSGPLRRRRGFATTRRAVRRSNRFRLSRESS